MDLLSNTTTAQVTNREDEGEMADVTCPSPSHQTDSPSKKRISSETTSSLFTAGPSKRLSTSPFHPHTSQEIGEQSETLGKNMDKLAVGCSQQSVGGGDSNEEEQKEKENLIVSLKKRLEVAKKGEAEADSKLEEIKTKLNKLIEKHDRWISEEKYITSILNKLRDSDDSD